MKDLIELEDQRLEWSLKTFPEATAISSLRKLETEIKEIEHDLEHGKRRPEEYADALMCLFDSAGRAGISPKEIINAFAQKLEVNKARTWVKNPDNSYSHVKSVAAHIQPELPTTLESAVDYLLPRFDGMEGIVEKYGEKEFALYCHSQISGGIGMSIRNELKLWQPDTPLHQYFLAVHSLYHPDDMSNLILTRIHRKLKNRL